MDYKKIADLCFPNLKLTVEDIEMCFKQLPKNKVDGSINIIDALVLTKDYQVVKIITSNEVYFDGRSILGFFVLVDTYHYVTKSGIYKVIPVYVRYSEYRKYSIY